MANLRTRPAGATTTTPVSSILQHDGLGRLVSVTETNGVTVQYQYQAGGLRFSRKVLQNGQLTAYSAFVYDSMGHLLEEYDRSGATNVLIGRYYYGNSDAPVAADLMAPGSGLLKRYYYLRDASQSVVAMVDGAGLVQERVWYDPHGSAVIEERDTSGPKVSSITGDTNGLIYVVLSEPVLPYTGGGRRRGPVFGHSLERHPDGFGGFDKYDRRGRLAAVLLERASVFGGAIYSWADHPGLQRCFRGVEFQRSV
jgi:YD repeat-containing protein